MKKIELPEELKGCLIVVGGAAGGAALFMAVMLAIIIVPDYLERREQDRRNAAADARMAAEEQVRKEALLAEFRALAAGEITSENLSKDAEKMLNQAAFPHERTEGRPVKVYPELYHIVPGVTPPDLNFDADPVPTPEEYQRRVSAFLQKHKEVFEKSETTQIIYEEYLRLDRRELLWLITMGQRINDEVLAKAGAVAMKAPMLKDAILAARIVHIYGSGQNAYSASIAGYDPNDDQHGEFSDCLGRLLIAGGHDYFVSKEGQSGAIWLPNEKPKEDVHSWSGVFNPKDFTFGKSFMGVSMDPTVLTDLTGRIVAVQVGRDALRATFYDDKGDPQKLTPAFLELAKLLGISAEKINAQWMRIDETTWELRLGA